MSKEPKNIHIALVKKEDIEKSKDKRIIKNSKEWEEVREYCNRFIYDEGKGEIFLVNEVHDKLTLKKDGVFKSEYWERDYSGSIAVSKGLSRRILQVVNMEYSLLRRRRLSFLGLMDEFERWKIQPNIKK